MSGSLRELTPGRWELRVSLGKDPVTGRRRQLSRIHLGGRRSAGRALAALVAATTAEHGPVAGGTDTTVAQLLTAWFEHIAYQGRSPLTLKGYQWRINKVLVPALGSTPLRKLKAGDIDRLYRALADKGHKPRTIRQTHAVLRRALSQAVRWGWMTSNPAADASPPSVERANIHAPAPEDVLRLLEHTQHADPVFHAYLRLAAATGARRGELCGLRWTDFDELGRVRIERSIVGVDGQRMQPRSTKTHGVRIIPLDRETIRILDGHLAAMRVFAAEAGTELVPNAYVFMSSRVADGSAPWHPDSATHRFSLLRDELGLPHLHLHTLRHWVATRLIADGLDVRAVADRLGHASAKMTLDVYASAVEGRGREAADLLGRALTRG